MSEWPWAPQPEDPLADIKRDMGTMITHTCLAVKSSHEAFKGMAMNVPRSVDNPTGKGTYRDGTTIEFIDLGMPQLGVQFGTIADLLRTVEWAAKDAELEL